jgi:hypothetical protein
VTHRVIAASLKGLVEVWSEAIRPCEIANRVAHRGKERAAWLKLIVTALGIIVAQGDQDRPVRQRCAQGISDI